MEAAFVLVPLMMVLFELFIFGVAIAGTVFWVWMLVDCATNEPSTGNDKLMWVLIILFTHLVGAIIYYFVRRPQRRSLYGQ
ncbi:MAG: PLD nuclease N-terminal domain-containing protein [Coriobacteriia bacterium]|nr:PLD nuclease N-terminal domain-containing protein [Coriobacteriia bacterium]